MDDEIAQNNETLLDVEPMEASQKLT